MTKRNYYYAQYTCFLRSRPHFTGSCNVDMTVRTPAAIMQDLKVDIAKNLRSTNPELAFDDLQISAVYLLHTEDVPEPEASETTPVSSQASTLPEAPGYALISLELLEQWGKLEEVRGQCRYPINPVKESN